MYVRLGFAVAINVDPDILLVDEVLAVGDEAFQRKCMREVRRVQGAGPDDRRRQPRAGDMRGFCDEIAWLDHGKVVEVGPAAATIDKYIEAGHMARPVATRRCAHGSGEIWWSGSRCWMRLVRRAQLSHR